MAKAKATRVRQNRFTFYSAVIPGKTLLPSSFVSRRNEDRQQGFNRVLSRTRAIDIARYLDRGLSIPTNVILSAQPGANLTFTRGTLTWDEVPDAFLIIDGQHRLFSMEHSSKDYEFVVAIYNDLSRQDEVQLFIDINTNQKGVPPALLLDIKQLAGTETTIEERLRRIFDLVAANRDSPLYGAFSPAEKKAGKISRVTFNSALKNVVEAGVLATMTSTEDQAKLIVNYLIAADRVIVASGAQHNNLTKATILQSFFEVFNEVADVTLGKFGHLRPNDLSEIMSPLISIDYDAYVGSNRPSKAKLVADMRSALIASPTVTSDML